MVAERFPVEAGAVQAFTRALGVVEPDCTGSWTEPPRYAPPTFVQASAHHDPEAPFRPRPGVPWSGSGSLPSGTAASEAAAEPSLHAEQRYEYQRPVEVGEVLTARRSDGARWTKTNRQGELLRFAETVTDYLDGSGALVVRATGVVVRFGPEGEAA